MIITIHLLKLIKMKKTLLTAAVLLIISLGSIGQTKRALIIAIGNYDYEKNGWRPISALNDVPLIQTALEKQNFPVANIKTLTDEMATRAGIEKALDDLIKSAGTGDIVVVHISSHGQQLEDDNVSEEMDGLDEAIVPYGATYYNDKSVFNKVAAVYFWDDVFGEKVTQLRNKLGKNGDVLVSIDACHSGSGTRGGVALARGNNSPMVSDNFSKKKLPAKDAAGVFKENTRTKLSTNSATYVVISGAQAQELNYECLDDQNKPWIPFLHSAMSVHWKRSLTALFARIEEVMREKAPKQKPVLEGDGIDRELFGGKYLRQLPYITINPEESNNTTIALKAGTVSGATIGSVVSFYPVGTTDPTGKKPLAKGKIVTASNFISTVKLDNKDDGLVKKMPWGFITETVYGNNRIKLGLDSLTEAEGKTVRDILKDFQLADINSKCELYLGKSESHRLCLRYANTVRLGQIEISKTEA
jgi:hypothetical protein